jgi:Na+/melibiose symporter-like transporter
VLRRFDLNPFYVGLLFGIKDGANSISSPIWGYVCDKNRNTSVKPYMIMSAILVVISFFLMGAGSIVNMDITL